MYRHLLVIAAAAIVIGVSANEPEREEQEYKHVALFSVDGFHSSDVAKYVATNPKGAIAQLLKNGYEYQNAFTSQPSDSFPGTLSQFTGASPRTTGVWYDNIFDRSIYEPYSVSKTHCSGPPGAQATYDETIDYNDTELFSGGINPDNLPQGKKDGKCSPIYPHSRLRVNTIWEVVQAAGKETAYTDKHPAYDLVRGPSGEGLTTGYFPEIAAVENTVDAVIKYDSLHVDAFLKWIDGKMPDHSEIQGKGLTKTPTLFGGNFQCINVGQKTKGYVKGTLAFTPDLLKAFDFVDASLGKVVEALKAKKIYHQTLIIVASKHGQAPIDPTLFRKVDPDLVSNYTGVDILSATTDDVALLFLKDQSKTQKAVDGLNAHRKDLQIQDIIYGERLTALGFGDPKKDPAVPDIIVRPELGVIYTNSKKKLAEHGGLSDDDRKVACFVSNPQLKKKVVSDRVSTRQVATTVLKVLGLDEKKLKGAEVEGTKVLPCF